MEVLDGSHAGLGRAVELLRSGEVVAFPTDTVYGLAALASDAAAGRRIYEIKGRSHDQPLILMAAKPTGFEPWVVVDGRARRLMERFWPGALTLVLPARDDASATKGVRIPNHPVAVALLRAAGEALVTTSCNRSGEPPALDAVEAATLPGPAAVVDGGRTPGGQPSTVLDLSSVEPRILRAGPVAETDIRSLLD